MRRWYYKWEEREEGPVYIGNEPIDDPGYVRPWWYTAHTEADLHYDHPGFPGTCPKTGHKVTFPPVPGRDWEV